MTNETKKTKETEEIQPEEIQPTEETKKLKKVQYISKYHNLKLINKAAYTKEVGGRVVVVQGSSIQFEDGVYETDDKNEIAFLDNHPNYGNVFIKVKEKQDAQKAKEEYTKTLEQKNAELQAKLEKLEKKKMAKKGQEEGAKPPTKGIRGTESTKETKEPKF